MVHKYNIFCITNTHLIGRMDDPSRILAVSYPFCYGLVEGWYPMEQYVHAKGRRLISHANMQHWYFLYCLKTSP